MKIVVVGGAGAMGRIIIRDMVEMCPEAKVVVADFDSGRARDVARSFGRGRATSAGVDVTSPPSMKKVFAGAFAVINSAPYQWNVEVMKGAAAARCHYVDLGGLFHVTRRQLKLDRLFRQAGRLALIGMGAAPGITNLLAAAGCACLDSVAEIHIRLGSRDLSKYKRVPALPVSYSLQTILEEFSLEPAVFTRGKFRFVEPMSGAVPHPFPPPVGTQLPFYTLHSEVATLPLSFKPQGVKEVSFKIAFDEDFTRHVRFLRDMGFGSHEPIQVRGVEVRPIEVVNRVAMAQPPAVRSGPARQHEVVRAIVKGKRAAQKSTLVLDCATAGMPKWGIGTDINTGSPPAIAVQMLLRGEITGVGVLPPEFTVPTEPFFRHLARRAMSVRLHRHAGWNFPI